MLKACRLDRRLRQSDVAAKIERDQAMVSKVESGERRLDVIELRRWLIAIGVDFVAFAAELDEQIRSHAMTRGSPFRRDVVRSNGENGEQDKSSQSAAARTGRRGKGR
jgi:transcriptional regulator with XRE-family HTH domain